jgi:phosphate:Na+ symporter
VDALHGSIIAYLKSLGEREWTSADATTASRLMDAANNLENIGDIIETDLMTLADKRLAVGLRISPDTREKMQALHGRIADTLRLAIRAVTEDAVPAARQVDARKLTLYGEADALLIHIRDRLHADAPNRLEAYKIETDVVERLKRIYYFSKHISRTVLDDRPDDAVDDSLDAGDG